MHDIDSDGHADLLVDDRSPGSIYAGGEVAVLVGEDAPVLQRIEIVGNPYGLATGDFDGDGRVDFSVANEQVGLRQCFSDEVGGIANRVVANEAVGSPRALGDTGSG